jgi:hypothetical protein
MLADSGDVLTQLKSVLTKSEVTGPTTTLESNIGLVVNVALILAFGVSFAMSAVAFIQLATSAGDPKRVEKTKDALTWSVVGMLVSLALITIKNVVVNLLGLEGANLY